MHIRKRTTILTYAYVPCSIILYTVHTVHCTVLYFTFYRREFFVLFSTIKYWVGTLAPREQPMNFDVAVASLSCRRFAASCRIHRNIV
jgi:hypothetical protein